jgi:hypothetical protein
LEQVNLVNLRVRWYSVGISGLLLLAKLLSPDTLKVSHCRYRCRSRKQPLPIAAAADAYTPLRKDIHIQELEEAPQSREKSTSSKQERFATKGGQKKRRLLRHEDKKQCEGQEDHSQERHLQVRGSTGAAATEQETSPLEMSFASRILQMTMPSPSRRLRTVGSSYVVPFRRIARCHTDSVTFEIPSSPGGDPARLPTYAELLRPTSEGPWHRVVLTAGIPSSGPDKPALFLSCGPCGRDVGHIGARSGGDDCCCCGDCWLAVHDGAGHRVACIVARGEGGCTLQRRGLPAWEISVDLDKEEPQIEIEAPGSGRKLAQAEPRGRPFKCAADTETGGEEDREDCLQVDTEPEPSSPESKLLLLTVLALIVFQGHHMQGSRIGCPANC